MTGMLNILNGQLSGIMTLLVPLEQLSVFTRR